MNKMLIEQITENLRKKETEELVEIWKENDRNQYSDEAFEAIRQILAERGQTIPPQKQFIIPQQQFIIPQQPSGFRIRRRTFAMVWLFTMLLGAGLDNPKIYSSNEGIIFALILAIFMCILNIRYGVGRLHDMDRTGWWILMGFVPILNLALLLALLFRPPTPGTNRFGPNPRKKYGQLEADTKLDTVLTKLENRR